MTQPPAELVRGTEVLLNTPDWDEGGGAGELFRVAKGVGLEAN